MSETNKAEIQSAAGKLLRAFFQFRFVYKNERMPHPKDEGTFGDLRHSEIMLLFMLAESCKTSPEGVNASDLSRMLHVKPPSVTPLLARLEKRELICRTMDMEDRRIVRVVLCKKGKEMIERHKKKMLERMNGLVEYLGVERSLLLTELINDSFAYFKKELLSNA